jgi:hypothetical protein
VKKKKFRDITKTYCEYQPESFGTKVNTRAIAERGNAQLFFYFFLKQTNGLKEN